MRPREADIDGLTVRDFMLVAILVLLSAGLYGGLAYRLAQGVYSDYYNLAFDFDPVRMVWALAGTPPDFLGIKHPFVVLLRPLAWPLLMVGMSPKEAVGLIMASFGAAKVALCFIFLRKALIEWPIAAALTLLFIVTGTQIFTSIITETYGVAAFSIMLTWVIAQARIVDANRFRRLRYVAGVLTFGTTITNVVQTFIAEMLVSWRWEGLKRAIRRCIIFGIVLTIPIVILSVAVWYNPLREELRDPVLALKHVLWQNTKGPHTGIGQVLRTFFLLSFVSPVYSWLMLPEGINMRDFREYAFPFPGQIAAPLWLVFCAVGTVAGFCHRGYRIIALGLAAALAFNLLFHLDFQFRGSLYIYTAHVHFLVFALAAGLAPWLTVARWPGKSYVAVVLLLAVLVGADNLPIARTFVTDFVNVIPSCAPPCADGIAQ
jgi:hypothetical protein